MEHGPAQPVTGLYLGLGGPNIDSNMFVEALVYPPGKPIYLAEDFFIHLPLFEMRATLVGWLRFTMSVHYLSTRTPRGEQRTAALLEQRHGCGHVSHHKWGRRTESKRNSKLKMKISLKLYIRFKIRLHIYVN